MKVKHLAFTLAIAALALGGTVGATQASASAFVVKVGVADVVPQSNTGSILGGAASLDIGNSVRPSITGEFMITPNLGVELLAAWPFRNTIKATSPALGLKGDKVATVDVLPPTLSLQWHFLPDKTVSPFIGVGVNYTIMFDEDTNIGPLAGNNVDIDNSWGVAAHVGVDFNLEKNWLITADLRWIQMRNDVKLNGAYAGTVDVNPWVWGLSVGYRF